MSQDYLFKEIRKGVTEARQIAAAGYCTADFMEGKCPAAVLVRDEKETALPCTYTLTQTPISSSHHGKQQNLSRMLTVAVQFPLKIEPKDRIRLFVKTEDGIRKQLCSVKAERVIKELQSVNCAVDTVKEEGGMLVIRGWAIDHEALSFTLKDQNTGEALALPEHMPEWYIRSEIMRRFTECTQPAKIGFSIKLPLLWAEKQLALNVQAGRYTREIALQKTKEKKTGPLNTLYVNILRVRNNTQTFGFRNTITKIRKHLAVGGLFSHKDYNRWIRRKMLTDQQREMQKKQTFSYMPKFSILVPLYESDETYLRELIESVQAQTYANWELCFSDGSKDSSRLQAYLKPFQKQDDRIRYIAQQSGPLGISENTNQAYEIATGDYIVLGDHDDLFTEDALFECVKALNKEKVQVIYTDEDKIDETGKKYFAPNFKPDFNKDLLRCNNYICHMFVAEKALVEKVGLFNPDYNGAQDYDFIFRCVEQADGICHIPRVLYHWRAHTESTAEIAESKLYAFEAGKRAIEAHLERMGLSATVEDGEHLGLYKVSYAVQGQPLISIVIPNKDHIDDLKKCINAIDEKSTYRNYEYIIVENNSESRETFDYYKQLEMRDNVKVVYWPEEFNYSKINNFGVEQANGDYILLLNNDTEMIDADSIEQMLGYCQREDVGIVGAKLYFEDHTIQHAGVVVGYGGIAGHAFSALNEDEGIYQWRTKVSCDYSAVTAACLMIKKEVYDAVGGFESKFRVAFNDVDFCLRVRQLGKLVVYVPQAEFYHYESKSRGLEDTPEKLERFTGEMQLFKKRWADILESGDPFYNENLALDAFDFSIRV